MKTKYRALSMLLSLLMLLSILPIGAMAAKSEVDVVFVIDSTGSMDEEINGVKENLCRFTQKLEESGVDYRIAVVDYQDITYDGNDSTRILTKDGQSWFYTAEDAETVIETITLGNGGDYEETLVDAFGCMIDELTFRPYASKFAIALTDADYKPDNNYGYASMDAMIAKMQQVGISTSVITTESCRETYRPLYEGTDGMYCNIYGDFAEELIKLAEYVERAVRPVELKLTTTKVSAGTYTLQVQVASTDEELAVENMTLSLLMPDGMSCAQPLTKTVAELTAGGTITHSWNVTVPVGEDDAVYTYSVKAESESFATGVVCVAQDTFSTIGTGADSYVMEFGRDNYSFINADYAFGGGSYYISDRDLAAYLDNFENSELALMAEWYGADGSIAALRRNDLSVWEGSCYGMSLTSALFRVGLLDSNDWGADTVHGISAIHASDNTALESMINVYHISQASDLAIDARWGADAGTAEFDDVMQSIWRKAENVGVSGAAKEQPFVVLMFGAGGHAVICFGAERGTFSHNGNTYTRRLRIMDPNNTTEQSIYISNDFTSAVFSDGAYTDFYIENTTLSDLNEFDYDDSLANYTAKLDASGMTEYAIETASERVVIIGGKVVSGDLDVTVHRAVSGSADDKYVVMLPEADADYTVIPADGEKLDAQIYLKDGARGVTGDAEKVTFGEDGTIEVADAAGGVSMSLVFNDGNADFVTVAGEADGSLAARTTRDGILITGYEGEYTVTNTTEDGKEYEVTVRDGEDTLITADSDGDLTVYVDGDNDGKFDDLYEEAKKSIWEILIDGGTGIGFDDVSKDDWFYEDVKYVVSHGLMNGTGKDTFAPHEATTRGMIVTILYRYAGEPSTYTDCPFTDVAAGSYYENAVKWAAANGIVSGYSANSFGPDDAITREQLATILYRFSDYWGRSIHQRSDLSGYADAGSISPWAKDAMQWANAEGLINGTDRNCLAPQGFAKRCEVAAILHRYCDK